MPQFESIRKVIADTIVAAAETGTLSKPLVLNTIIKDYQNIIEPENDNLIRTALNKIVNEVFNYKTNGDNELNQLAFVGMHPYVPVVTQLSKKVSSSAGQNRTQLTGNIRRRTIKLMVAEHDKQKENSINRTIEFYRSILNRSSDADDHKTLKELLAPKIETEDEK